MGIFVGSKRIIGMTYDLTVYSWPPAWVNKTSWHVVHLKFFYSFCRVFHLLVETCNLEGFKNDTLNENLNSTVKDSKKMQERKPF